MTVTPHDRLVVVLNEPQDLVNIAATVRAMMNFGVARLRLVKPAEYDAWRIKGIAHGSEEVLARTERYGSLREAIGDAAHVVGTTARRRTATYVWEHPRQAARALLERAAGGTVALVFGREDAGLSNEELDLCDRLVTVPTNPRHPSLNLAQAVLLVLYELWLAGPGVGAALPLPKRAAEPAGPEELERLFESAEEALAAIDFYKSRQPAAILRTLRAAARRASLDVREARLLRAIAIETRKTVSRLRRTPP